MTVWPLRFRKIDGDGPLLFADEAGGFFSGDERFLARYGEDRLSNTDLAFLHANGHAFQSVDDLSFTSFALRWSLRQARRPSLSYIILVPTLRCNLACTYCQVARADEHASGYDWSGETLNAVLAFLEGLSSDSVKIEFQGGEPLLRLDLLDRVREHCRRQFQAAKFVVCTNLQNLAAEHWEFLAAEDTYVSTSLDGDSTTHQSQRTRHAGATDDFFLNLNVALERFGPGRVSALPTIDIRNPPTAESLVDTYCRHGFRSIYLRPVNYQGFARKNSQAVNDVRRWNAYHESFVDYLISRNYQVDDVMEEFYFSHCLRRIFQPGLDGHVDLRNPSPVADDYVVIDHDGTLYPTDEARMLARVNAIDLSIGHVDHGLNESRISQFNANALNNFDPDCVHCPYQPFCGVDNVDDISRYGRVDLPRHTTWFCARQTAIFDKAFALIYSEEPAVQYSLAKWLGIEAYPPELATRLA